MATYRNIKVKKPNGGFRTQRAMVLASGKLKFVSNKHKGGASAPRKATVARKSKSKAITKSKRRHHLAKMPRRRRGGGGGGMNLLHLGLAAGGLAFMTGPKSPAPSIAATAKKIPVIGTTFAAPAAIGVTALAIDRFAYRNKWLRLIGAAGIVLAAAEVGSKGTDFKVQDLDDEGVADVGDDDDDMVEGDEYDEG